MMGGDVNLPSLSNTHKGEKQSYVTSSKPIAGTPLGGKRELDGPPWISRHGAHSYVQQTWLIPLSSVVAFGVPRIPSGGHANETCTRGLPCFLYMTLGFYNPFFIDLHWKQPYANVLTFLRNKDISYSWSFQASNCPFKISYQLIRSHKPSQSYIFYGILVSLILSVTACYNV